MVYNTRSNEHAAFNRSRARFGTRHPVFTFRENRHAFRDPSDFEPDNLHNTKNLPGGQVRRQTFDYAHMLRECAWGGASPDHPESFVLIIEVGRCENKVCVCVRVRACAAFACVCVRVRARAACVCVCACVRVCGRR
jgi:hypothetical protein